jgi:putative AdoMet-dependent methyltransferase
MVNQFYPAEFDEWAATYDDSVSTDRGFPFDGYSRVIHKIVDLSAAPPGASVLDLGTGTGNLIACFSGEGRSLYGLDFSAEMLNIARVKLPGVTFGEADLRGDWPSAFQRSYDCIVSGYTFHHFPLPEKISLVQHLITHYLTPHGCLVIGDIAFQDAAEEEALRSELGEEWEQEYYWLAGETIAAFADAGIEAHFQKISSCAGVFRFSPKI